MALSGCVSLPEDQIGLRVTNEGPYPITDLKVLFPESEIDFGTVTAGQTTSYQAAEGGVYRYAAFRFTVTGEPRSQPVIDWMGESPLRASRVTYVLDFDPNRESRDWLRLVNVTIDKPAPAP